jgi:hypothetical protein
MPRARLDEAREVLKEVYGLPPFERGSELGPSPAALQRIRKLYCHPYGLTLPELEERTGIDVLRRQWERIKARELHV